MTVDAQSGPEVFLEELDQFFLGCFVAKFPHPTLILDMAGFQGEVIELESHADWSIDMVSTIKIYLEEEAQLQAAVAENKSYILSETLATALTFKATVEQGIPLEFDTIKTTIQIKKLKS